MLTQRCARVKHSQATLTGWHVRPKFSGGNCLFKGSHRSAHCKQPLQVCDVLLLKFWAKVRGRKGIIKLA